MWPYPVAAAPAALPPSSGSCPCLKLDWALACSRAEVAALDALPVGPLGEVEGLPLFAALMLRRRLGWGQGVLLPTGERTMAATLAALRCPTLGAGLVVHVLAWRVAARSESWLAAPFGPVLARCGRPDAPQAYLLALQDPGLRLRTARGGGLADDWL